MTARSNFSSNRTRKTFEIFMYHQWRISKPYSNNVGHADSSFQRFPNTSLRYFLKLLNLFHIWKQTRTYTRLLVSCRHVTLPQFWKNAHRLLLSLGLKCMCQVVSLGFQSFNLFHVWMYVTVDIFNVHNAGEQREEERKRSVLFNNVLNC